MTQILSLGIHVSKVSLNAEVFPVKEKILADFSEVSYVYLCASGPAVFLGLSESYC